MLPYHPYLGVRTRHLLILACFAIALPIAQLLAASPEFFIQRRVGGLDLAILGFIGLVVIPLLIALPYLVLSRFGDRIVRLAFALTLYLLLALIALYPFNRAFPLDNFPMLLALVTAALGLRLYHDFEAVRQFVTFLSIGFLVFPILLWRAFTPHPDAPSAIINTTQQGDRPPVIVVVLDELPLVTLLGSDYEIDKAAFPNFARLQQRSHWFRNATTPSTFTHVALPSIVTGRFPRTDRPLLPSYLDYPENLFTILGSSYRMNVFEQVTNFCPDSLCGDWTAGESRSSRIRRLVIELANLEMRMLLPRPIYVAAIDHAEEWGERIDRWSGFRREGARTREDFRGLLHVSGRDDDRKLFLQFLLSLAGEPALSYIHITFPHTPYSYLPDGREYYAETAAINSTGYRENAAEHPPSAAVWHQRYLLQLRYTDRLIGLLLEKLETLGIFDRAAIIVTADHGSCFSPGEPTRFYKDGNREQLMLVPLFVKLPGQSEGTVSDRNVEHADLLPTLLGIAGLSARAGLDGSNIFSGSERREKAYYSLTNAGTSKRIPLPAHLKGVDFSAYQERLFGVGLANINHFGIHPELIGAPPPRVPPAGIAASFAASIDDAERFETVSPRGRIPALVQGKITGAGSVRTMVLGAVVNGTVAAIGFSGPLSGSGRYEIMIPEHALREGKNSIAVIPIEELREQDLRRLIPPPRTALEAGPTAPVP